MAGPGCETRQRSIGYRSFLPASICDDQPRDGEPGVRRRLQRREFVASRRSIRPVLFTPLAENLAAASLVTQHSRVVLEKPLGHDLASSRAINDAIARVFSEPQTFRIDHYLGKEAVQNLLVLRFANSLFEPFETNEVANLLRYLSHRPFDDNFLGDDRTGTAQRQE